MRGTVTSVSANGTFESQYGLLQENGKKLMFKFEITIGDHTGEYSTNKYIDKEAQDFPFVQGVETDYEFVDGQYPKIKLPKKDFTASKGSVGGDAVQLMIVRQSSLKCALDLIRHNAIGDDSKIKADDVEELAGRFTAWVMNTEKAKTPTEELMSE